MTLEPAAYQIRLRPVVVFLTVCLLWVSLQLCWPLTPRHEEAKLDPRHNVAGQDASEQVPDLRNYTVGQGQRNETGQLRLRADSTGTTPKSKQKDRDRSFDDWVGQGCLYMSMMNEEAKEAVDKIYKEHTGQTTGLDPPIEFLTFEALENNGWDWQPIQADVKTCPGGLAKLGIEGKSVVKYATNTVQIGNSKTYRHKGTHAHYQDFYDIKDGVIITKNRIGPEYARQEHKDADAPIPTLKTWADVAWIQWQRWAQGKAKEQVGPGSANRLKWFVSLSVTNELTSRVVRQVLWNNGWRDKQWPSVDDNVKFGMDTNEGRAILATPNARAYAWFLLLHRADTTLGEGLGWKRIESVQIFGPDMPAPRLVEDRDGNSKDLPKGFGRPGNTVPGDSTFGRDDAASTAFNLAFEVVSMDEVEEEGYLKR